MGVTEKPFLGMMISLVGRLSRTYVCETVSVVVANLYLCSLTFFFLLFYKHLCSLTKSTTLLNAAILEIQDRKTWRESLQLCHW